ncbi:sugar transport protein [Stachybotrys elegans]|uniref:Sugar transport protein n=1 Tax=Stachybotrys elegans TaxID=80388 RepID=A0A8K0SWW0_9HYPO|nr:sugar transport protein [Stachybotrys elegans]
MNLLRWPLYLRACLIASSAGVLFGLDTGSIGPVTSMPVFEDAFGHFSPTMHGVIVSSLLITGALAALFAGIFADRYGHVRLIIIGTAVYSIGAAIECSSFILGVLVLGRLIKGLGLGLFLSNIYVQTSELSPRRIRGIMTAVPQFAIASGIVMGYFICYGCARLQPSSLAWRLPIAIASALGFGVSVNSCFLPPSPRWLIRKGRYAEARRVLSILDLDPAEQEELLTECLDVDHVQVTEPTLLQALRETFREFREAFKPPFRRGTAFGCFIMAFQQFSGIDGVLYYAPILFTQAGLQGGQATLLASGGTALVILIVTVPATLMADRWDRRTSSILGGIGQATLMIIIGCMYAAGLVGDQRNAGTWVVIISIYVYTFIFNGTWAIAFRTFLVESLPRKTRSSAASLAQASNWVANYLVALITPLLLARSTFGAYFLFAGCTIFCTILVIIFMTETRGHSLEEIERMYLEKSARRHGTLAQTELGVLTSQGNASATDGR